MLSVTDVEYAYRLILGREAESPEVLNRFVEKCSSINDLRTMFLASPEFRAELARLSQSAATTGSTTQIKPINWGKARVDVRISKDELFAMIGRVEATWEELGRVEPHWSVLTHDKFRADVIGKNEAAFFASGEIAANAMRSAAMRCGIDIRDYETCFELGCGVGRVTVWLATMFRHILAADISAPHLGLAKETLDNRNARNVKLMKVAKLEDIARLPQFDSFFSVIVLQHNPPPVIGNLLGVILQKLRPDGIGYFQVPTYSLGYEFHAEEYLSNFESAGKMEMHVFPQDALFEVIEESDCQLLEIREDGWTGDPKTVSNSVFVRKRSQAPRHAVSRAAYTSA